MRGPDYTTAGGTIDPELPEGLVDELMAPLQAGLDVDTEEYVRQDIARELAAPPTIQRRLLRLRIR